MSIYFFKNKSENLGGSKDVKKEGNEKNSKGWLKMKTCHLGHWENSTGEWVKEIKVWKV